MSTKAAVHHDDHHDHPKGMKHWFTTTNHKDIGSMYLIFSLIMFFIGGLMICLLYTSPSPRDRTRSRMPSSA